jgi:hypothetical protein
MNITSWSFVAPSSFRFGMLFGTVKGRVPRRLCAACIFYNMLYLLQFFRTRLSHSEWRLGTRRDCARRGQAEHRHRFTRTGYSGSRFVIDLAKPSCRGQPPSRLPDHQQHQLPHPRWSLDGIKSGSGSPMLPPRLLGERLVVPDELVVCFKIVWICRPLDFKKPISNFFSATQ